MFLPKIPECSQCPSCPFRTGNDKEFGEIVAKLRAKAGLPPPVKFDVFYARMELLKDVTARGDFVCHHTAYDANMELRDPKHHRQCPGATTAHNERSVCTKRKRADKV